MHIIRFADRDHIVRVGLTDSDSPAVTALDGPGGPVAIADLLALDRAEFDHLVTSAATRAATHARDDITVLPPIDGVMEVWASGVTYQRSREARMEESAEQSVYARVYDAERPELFMKAVPWRVVTDGEPIAIREDSELNVPEPELGLVANRHGEIAGYLVVDDVSSRSIEGDNPLYLPQAKIYAGSTALSAGIRPAFEVENPHALDIALRVRRGNDLAYDATVSTASMRRTVRDLVDYLFRCQPFPGGAVLATGTGIVPAMDFTLLPGDVVEIEITHVGTLTNPVVKGLAAMSWLAEAARNPGVRERQP